MAISDTTKKKMNKMNRASQDASLGTIIQNLASMSNQSASAVIITGGSIVVSDLTSSSAVIDHLTAGSIVNQRMTSGSVVSTQMSSGTAKFGDATNYTAFAADGSMSFSGSATVWDDLFVPLTTAKQGQNNKPAFDETRVGYLFPAGDTTAKMYLVVQFPHAWKEGSRIHPHVHYEHAASGSPVFKMDYLWHNIGGTSSGSFTTYTMSTREYPWTSGSVHQLITNPTGIDGTGKTMSSIMLIKLYRDDSAYTGDLLTYQFDIHLEKDSLGSKTEYTK